MIHEAVIHAAMQEISLSVCVVMAGLTLAHRLVKAQTGVQPRPATQSPIGLT